MNKKLLMIIIQNLVLFPNQEIKLELSNEQSKKTIIEATRSYSSELLVVIPKDEESDILKSKDIREIGSFVKIKSAMELPNGNIRITLRGVKRVKISSLNELSNGLIEVETNPIETPEYNLERELAYTRKLKNLITKYVEINSRVSNTVLAIIKNVSNLNKLTDMISATIDLNFKQKTKLLQEIDYYKRAHMLITILNNEIMSIELENKIEEEVREKFEKSEKEILIKERIDALSREIGISDEKKNKCDDYNKIIDELKISEKTRTSMKREVKSLEIMSENSPEYGSLRTHLDFITSLPWNKSSKDEKDIKKIDDHLNGLHYGLDKAKERIEEYLSLRKMNKNIFSPVLCLIGPPGTGKTTFARELAASTNREFVKVSVGGLNDSSELIGHRRTYIGAGPGKIMDGIRKCGVNNPIILIDEVDKMVKDYKGDPSSVLLEILDQNQNKEFVDNYVQEPFDLSNVLFILTANDESLIPAALYDRLEVIEVSSYTLFDKIEIAQKYTLPRLGKEYDFDYTKIKFSDSVISKIITEYTKEAGVRELERKISSIIRKVLIKGLDEQVIIKENDIEKYLGNEKFSSYANYYDEAGVVNVPAFTPTGGCLINIEAALYPGSKEIISTGSLGKVMEESALVALSYLKENSKTLKLDSKKLSETLHIHALDGATPKDGPSAGLGIAVAIASLVLNKKVSTDVAFTGEISLKGRILKVGGIKEKIISAGNKGIKKLFIPEENVEDLKKIPKKVLKNIEVVPVNTFTEVYKILSL